MTRLLVPEAISDAVIYLPSMEGEAEKVFELIGKRAVICAVSVDWNRDLSPCAAKKAFKGGEDFGGGAPGFLTRLTEEIIPDTEAALGFAPKKRIIAGYSMAGLFAAWSLYFTDKFSMAACCSPSFWFDGFMALMRGRHPIVTPEYVYISVGDKERKTKNPRMCINEACILEARDIFTALGANTFFEYNRGGHFDEPDIRLARGIAHLLKYV